MEENRDSEQQEAMTEEKESLQTDMTQAAKPIKEKSTGAKIALALLICVGILALAAFVQVVVSLVATISYMVYTIAVKGQALSDTKSLMEDEGMLTIILGASTLATTVIFTIWYRFQIVRKFGALELKSVAKRICKLRTLLLLTLNSLAIYMTSIVIITVLYLITPNSVEDYAELMGMVSNGNPIIVFVTVVILAPIGEECLFRGIILNRLQKVMPIAAAIILQAVLFGIYHANIVQGLYVLTLGSIAGYFAYKLKSIIPAILIHMLNNGLSYAGLIPDSILDNPFIVLGIIVSIIVAIVLVAKFMKEKPVGMEANEGME